MTAADPFMIRAHVPDWEASVADYRAASAATRSAQSGRRTVAYGDHPDEVLDLYAPPGRADELRPIHLFIHGGYWRAFSKEDYAFVADAIIAAGAIAAVMDYSLMPRVRMDRLIAQVRRAAAWLVEHAASFGGDARAFSASGHSAGAHLASFLVCRGPGEPDIALTRPGAVLLVSGLYDLEPITRSFLQPELQLTSDEVALWSPCHATPTEGAVVDLLVGENETPPFHTQAATFADRLTRGAARSRLTTVPGEDHMSIVRELGRPGSECARHLAATIARSQRESSA